MTKQDKAKSSTSSLRLEKREGGIAILWMDVPGEPVNTLKASFSGEFSRVFGDIENDAEVQGVVFASGKADSFLAGADITMLDNVETAGDATELSRRGQEALDRIEALGKPVVAAIHGACLGGGLEVALACHGRVASDHPKTKLGLPEVQLGLLPGAGGTQRLPRLVGAQQALDLMLTGRQVGARKAKKLGLVDQVVPEPIVIDVATELARKLVDEGSSKKGAMDRVKGLLHKDELTELALAENPLGRKVLFDQAKKKLLEKSRGNYPAPERILSVVKLGLAEGFERGLQAEREAFGDLVVSPEAEQLMGIFFATNALKKDSGVDDPKVEPRPLGKVGMIGAGLMGAGISYATASVASIPVRLKDINDEGVLRGLAYVREIVDGRVRRKRMSRVDADRLMSQVTGTTDYTGLAQADVIIEAVFEDLGLKHRVLQETEAACPDDTIFASNTSALPISKIAEASAHPETVIGMHYFSPVHKMPLLEIIVTDETAPWVTATCVELGKKQGKTVIVVRDGVGFYTTRILAPFMNEAAQIFAEGVAVEKIDAALVDFGFPVGPIKLTDEVGIDVGAKVAKITQEAFGDRMAPPDGMERLIADERFGRKNGRGFYLYGGDAKGGRGVDESVYALFELEPDNNMSAEEIAERCTLRMVNEAALCYGDGILRSARDGDIGAIFGLGFPPFRGGPFRYVDAIGPTSIVHRLELYRDRLGERFEPAPILVEMARSGRTFHGDSATQTSHRGRA